ERCHELGYEPLLGTEPEFYLLDGETRQPLFSGYHIFNSVRNTYVPLIEQIVEQMRAFGIDIITANCEYAGSQWEIVYGPKRGLAGPDQAFAFKNGVKELAHSAGLIATFLSKPFGKGGAAENVHVENRAPTGLSNPYLATAGLLAAGLLGIVDELELEPPAKPPAEEDASKEQLPTTVEESLALFEADERIVELLGAE